MNRSLVRNGFVLFLLALLTGFAIPALKIPRLGVSAHLVAAMGGLLLVAIGVVWDRLGLGASARAALRWLSMIGVFGNWMITLLSGVFGGSHFMPIASGGALSTPVEDTILSGGIVVVSLCSVAATLLVIWGLRGKLEEN